MPEISVIVPVYKVEPYLRKCVDSILAQTFQDFELILVDDGSPDQCGAICEEYARKCGNVIALHRENGGLSAARNTGIDWAMEHSDSRWLAFVDSDDYVHPDFLDKLYSACVEQNADMAMCDFARIDEAGESAEELHEFPCGVYSKKEELFRLLYLNWRTVVAWNKLYRKTLFKSIRYDNGKIHEDEFIIHKLLAECNAVCYTQEPLYYYLVRSGSIMTSEKEITNKMISLEAWIERYWFCRKKQLPVDERLTSVAYMSQVLELEKQVPKEDRARYLRLKKAYKNMFLDASNHPLKYRVLFDCYPFYKKRKGMD